MIHEDCVFFDWEYGTCSLSPRPRIRQCTGNCIRNKARTTKLCEQLGITPEELRKVREVK